MHIDALPLEVLSLILGLLPAPLRLHHASLASKKWRAAALRATTLLCSPADFPRAARLLPCLEHVRFTSPPGSLPSEDVRLPALRSISFETFWHADRTESLRRLVSRTTLTSVELPLSHTSDLLDACSAYLTAWHVSLLYHHELLLTTSLALPRLTSLTISCTAMYRLPFNIDEYRSSLRRLLSATHTQLTSLTVEMDDAQLSPFWSDLATLPLPRLTRLAARFTPPALAAAALAPVLQQCHPSVTLSLLLSGDPSASTAHLVPLTPWLTHLFLLKLPQDSSPLPTLLAASATRLTSLELGSSVRIKDVALNPALAAKVTRLSLTHTTPYLPLLTRLDTLAMEMHYDPARAPTPTLPSPSAVHLLRKLTLEELRQILLHFPQVRTLRAHVSGACMPEDLWAVLDTHAHLEQCYLRVQVALPVRSLPLRHLCGRRCVIYLVD